VTSLLDSSRVSSSNREVRKNRLWELICENIGSETNSSTKSPVLFFHLQGNYSGHYCVIYAAAEYLKEGEKTTSRVVLTSGFYQRPKRWLPIENVYRMIYEHKFKGYAILRVRLPMKAGGKAKAKSSKKE